MFHTKHSEKHSKISREKYWLNMVPAQEDKEKLSQHELQARLKKRFLEATNAPIRHRHLSIDRSSLAEHRRFQRAIDGTPRGADNSTPPHATGSSPIRLKNGAFCTRVGRLVLVLVISIDKKNGANKHLFSDIFCLFCANAALFSQLTAAFRSLQTQKVTLNLCWSGVLPDDCNI